MSDSDREISNRERILRAATSELSQYGFAGLRTDKVAQLAGCNKQLIYYYFGNKAGLRSAVLERMADEAIPGWERIAGLTIPETIAARSQERMSAPSGRLYPRLLAWEGAEHVSGDAIVLEERRTRAWQHLIDVFRHGAETGELDPSVDPEIAALVFALVPLASETLPQITRMITGHNPDDPEFQEKLDRTLRFLGSRLGAKTE